MRSLGRDYEGTRGRRWSRPQTFRLLRHNVRSSAFGWLLVLLALLTLESPAAAPQPKDGFPVRIGGRELLRVRHGVAFFDAKERARVIRRRLLRLIRENKDPVDLVVERRGRAYIIQHQKVTILQVTTRDARDAGLTRAALAERTRKHLVRELRQLRSARPMIGTNYVERQLRRLRTFSDSRNLDRVVVDLGLSGALILVLLIVSWLLNQIFNRIYSRLERYSSFFAFPVVIRELEILSAKQVAGIFIVGLRTLHLAVVLLLIFVFVDWVLFLFPDSDRWDIKIYVRGLVYAVLVTIVARTLYRTGRDFFDAAARSTLLREGRLLAEVRFQNMTLISQERLVELSEFLIGLTRLVYSAILLYLWAALVLSFFPATRGVTDVLFAYVAAPVQKVAIAIISYIPNLFFIGVVIVIAYYGNRFTRAFFAEIEKGRIRLPGFYRDWAVPTHRIFTFFIVAFSAVVVFPYLPGADSDAFKGISLFLGFVVSLSSSAVLANIIAGLVVTYMRPFSVGDRVRIADTVGDVVTMTLLVTRVRTVKNVEITIPNGMVLGSHIINYSTGARKDGVILHTAVTIGYDVPFPQVEEMLAQAARRTETVREDPPPFVLQKSLDDFYVSYELNAYTDEPDKMERIYSSLHRNIQAVFWENGVEILSPHYRAVRGGAAAAMPSESIPATYEEPAVPVRVAGARSVPAFPARAVPPEARAGTRRTARKSAPARKRSPARKTAKKKTARKKGR